MQSKYYIPKIEEFHAGFEYEEKHDSKYWSNETSDGSEIYHIGKYYLSEGIIRVKYLDKKDIESLGFRFTEEIKDIDLQYFETTYLNDNDIIDTIYLEFESKLQWCYIEKHNRSIKEKITIFDGQIKNKSELRVLLKQLKIDAK